MSKVAGTAGGQDALKILMGHMPDDEVEKKKIEELKELPDIKSHLNKFSFGSFQGMNKHYKKTQNQD